MITTYGLPPTLLRVFEYGGPTKTRETDTYVKYDKFSYSLEFDGINSNVKIPWGLIDSNTHPNGGTTDRSADSFEFRFNTWTTSTQSLMVMAAAQDGTDPRISLHLHPHPKAHSASSGKYNHGKLVYTYGSGNTFASASTEYMPVYDNDWWNLMVSRTTASYAGAQTFKISLAKTADHSNARMTHTTSVNMTVADETANWNQPKYFLLGQGTSSAILGNDTYFSGSMQEFRSWALPYSDQYALDKWNELKPFYNHCRDPLSIEGYGATGSYAQLLTRYSMGADLNRYSQSSTVASCSNFSGSVKNDWPTEEEKFYTAMPDLIGTREISDKTRIESAELVGRLDSRRKSERSQFDKAALDSNRVGVYYAPHFEIDLDIARELGGASFDNYVGNPLDVRDDEYKRLRVLRQHYWYKHDNPYDFHEYLKILRHLDHTLFRQIEMLIPARCNAQVGLLVKPNMLERPKVKSMFVETDENHYEGTIDTSTYKVRATTTTLGGPYYRGTRKTGQWSTPTGLNEELDALQAHTGFQTFQTTASSVVPETKPTDQAEGAVIAGIDIRKHYGHDLDVDGSRYIWRNMELFQWTYSDAIGAVQPNAPTGGFKKGEWYHNAKSYVQQAGASYENNGEFIAGEFDSPTDFDSGTLGNFVGFKNLQQTQSAHTIINASAAFKHYDRYADNNTPRKSGKEISSNLPDDRRVRTKFEDFGNIKNYHHQRISRIHSTKNYWYMAPKNNMHNSASTGGKLSVAPGGESGWTAAELANGFYRSGVRPVSSSYAAAEVQDYRPHAINNLYHGGCKLVGSDFNMPVLNTVDGGPVVEVIDTNPNTLAITGRTAAGGDISAQGETMQRSL